MAVGVVCLYLRVVSDDRHFGIIWRLSIDGEQCCGVMVMMWLAVYGICSQLNI